MIYPSRWCSEPEVDHSRRTNTVCWLKKEKRRRRTAADVDFVCFAERTTVCHDRWSSVSDRRKTSAVIARTAACGLAGICPCCLPKPRGSWRMSSFTTNYRPPMSAGVAQAKWWCGMNRWRWLAWGRYSMFLSSIRSEEFGQRKE